MISAETKWRERELAVLDVETTGLDPHFDRVIEIAALVVGLDGTKKRSFSTVVNPTIPIPAEATKANGITDAMVAEAPTFAEIARNLVEIVGDAIPAAFNARFDQAFVASEFVRAQVTAPAWLRREVDWIDSVSWIDPLTWARAADPYAKGKGRFKLGAVADRLGVKAGTAHRALGDCETTARVLRRLAGSPDSRFREQPPETYGATIRRQRTFAARFELEFLEWLAKQPPLPASATP